MMRWRWSRAKAAVLLLTALIGGAAGADAQQFEQPEPRALKDIVPADIATGPHYRIDPTVLHDGYMHHYAVESDYGPFSVTGDLALWKLLREIAVVAALLETKNSSVYVEGLKKATTAPLHFAKSLALHPVDTVTGVPRGTYQIMQNVAVGATTTRDPSQDSRVKEAIKFSSWKRDYANRAGVDPYSSNKVLQKELNSVAWAATVGDWSVTAALLPVGGGAATAVSSVRTSDSARNALKDYPPQRLRTINDDKLKAVGIPEALRKQFLDHPHFTPTHDTKLAEALSGLGARPGLDAFLQGAVTASDEVEANFYVSVAQILRAYHDVTPIRTLRAVSRRLVVAQGGNGVAIVPLPVDHLLWTEQVDRVSGLLKAYNGSGYRGRIELWTTGSMSERAKQQLDQRGIVPVERLGYRLAISE